jgi:hypothetical protein
MYTQNKIFMIIYFKYLEKVQKFSYNALYHSIEKLSFLNIIPLGT